MVPNSQLDPRGGGALGRALHKPHRQGNQPSVGHTKLNGIDFKLWLVVPWGSSGGPPWTLKAQQGPTCTLIENFKTPGAAQENLRYKLCVPLIPLHLT